MVGGVATEVVDASYHLREKSVVEVGVVGDLVDLFKGFGEAICFFKGGVYDCVVPNEVVDSGGFLSCQGLELSPVVELCNSEERKERKKQEREEIS
jgi:hypothetical protein